MGVNCIVPLAVVMPQAFWDYVGDPMTVSSSHCIGHEALPHPRMISYLKENSYMLYHQIVDLGSHQLSQNSEENIFWDRRINI